MTKKTVTVFGATGTVGTACVEELIRQQVFDVQVLARKATQAEKPTLGVAHSGDEKQRRYAAWRAQGVEIKLVDPTDHVDLIPALRGTDYLVSCTPYGATESQYPLIWAAREAGVERFVPSEFGAIYEFEQFWPTDTVHRTMARQKAFIRRVIELAGLDFTIIPAGLWPEFYLLEPVLVMAEGEEKLSWSSGPDVGRIIPHVLAHPASRNAICPVAATAYCSWNELLAVRERLLGRPVARMNVGLEQWRALYGPAPAGPVKELLAIGIAVTESPAGMSLFGHWNATFLPDFQGTPLEQLFPNYIEPFVAAMRAGLVAAGQLRAG
ncbi:MAG TPA: NmrA family NAD(P)-binding protein [Steroidobacteraceae bacterium]|nr:NmrA family NAD(P)-binding protein [Steroidobacteraceae bacterium]